ncbi:MAG: thiamine pyrophosphate-dependent enzyme, partial [Gaiellaceae bacterium]
TEQRKAWQRVDPIARFRKSLCTWNIATTEQLDELDEEIRAEMGAARNEAERAPHPGPESVYEDVFAA